MLKKIIDLIAIILSVIILIAFAIYAYVALNMHHVYVHHPNQGKSFNVGAYNFFMEKEEWLLNTDEVVHFKFKNPHLEGYNEAHIGWALRTPLPFSNRIDGFDNTSDGIVFDENSTNFCSIDIYLNENREIVKKEYKNNRFLWWCY